LIHEKIKELMNYLENFRLNNNSQTYSWDKLKKIGFKEFNLEADYLYKRCFRDKYPYIIYNGQYGFTLENKSYYKLESCKIKR